MFRERGRVFFLSFESLEARGDFAFSSSPSTGESLPRTRYGD